MKKIAFFTTSFDMGGVEKTFMILSNEFAKRNYEVDFIVCWKRGVFLSQLSSDIHVVDFGGIKLRSAFIKLGQYLNVAKPDYLIAGPDYPNVVAIIASKVVGSHTKLIVTQHNYFNISIKTLGVRGRLLPWLVRKLYPYAFKVVAVSNGIADFLKSLDIPENKIVRVYNPLDIAAIHSMANDRMGGVEYPIDFILFLGRLDVVKNIPLLLRAFKILLSDYPSLFLIIAGAGPEEKVLKQIILELGIERSILMKAPLINPFVLLSRARLLALPSFSEACPMVVVEALTLGKTVVSTPNKGAWELLNKGKFGYVTTAFENAEEFAVVLKQGMNKPFPASCLQKEANQYAVTTIITEFEQILN